MNWQKARDEEGLDKTEEVRARGDGANNIIAGIPMSEYTRASLQPCVRCKRDPRVAGAGKLLGIRQVEGVLVADTLCCDCMTPDELEAYQEIVNDGE
jgi:hypothetical protein